MVEGMVRKPLCAPCTGRAGAGACAACIADHLMQQHCGPHDELFKAPRPNNYTRSCLQSTNVELLHYCT